jgi:hypothetical protein
MAENKGKSKVRRKALGLKHVDVSFIDVLLTLSFILVILSIVIIYIYGPILYSSVVPSLQSILTVLFPQSISIPCFIWAYVRIINNSYRDGDFVDRVINHFKWYAVSIPISYFLLLFISIISFVFFGTYYLLLHNTSTSHSLHKIPLADYVEVDFTTTLTSATILVAINGWLFSTWTRRDTVRQNQQDRLMRIVRNTRDDVVFMYIVAVIALYYLLIFLLVKMGQPSLPSIFILSLILAIPPALVVGMVLHVLLAMVIIDVCTENPQMCT